MFLLRPFGLTVACLLVLFVENGQSKMKTAVYYFPFYDQAPSLQKLKDVTKYVNYLVGTVTAGGNKECDPYWEGKILVETVYFEMNGTVQLKSESDIPRKPTNFKEIKEVIFQLQSYADVGITFGGPVETDLVNTCSDSDVLSKAIIKVIRAYDVSSIDFNLDERVITESNMEKLCMALVKVISDIERQLTISFVIPIEVGVGIKPTVAKSLKKFSDIKDAIDLFMIKMYDHGSSDITKMIDTIHHFPKQLSVYYENQTRDLNASTGVVFMNGVTHQKGIKYSIFYVFNLMVVARKSHFGRVVLNSINRDTMCPSGTDLEEFQTYCSGVHQDPYEFTDIIEHFIFDSNNETVVTTHSPSASACVTAMPLLFTVSITIALLSRDLFN